jgi:NitT/TauT family transport system permease protein
MSILRSAFLGAAGIVIVFGVAEAVLPLSGADRADFPLPSSVVTQAADLVTTGAFLSAVGSTMVAWLWAMAITVAIAVPAGMLFGLVPWAESALRPALEFVRPIPSVVLLPLVLLIVQDNTRTEIAVIVIASVWPVLLNTVYGFREVDPLAKETLRGFGFGPLAVMWHVSVPSAGPFIATGVRIAASLAFVVAIAAELVGTGMNGVGAFAGQAQGGTDAVPVMIAVAALSGVIGLAINAALTGAERHAFRWHFARAGAAQGEA